MSIKFQILGQPFKDNALMVFVNTGMRYYRLLFDCGEGCLADMKSSEISSIDYLFFSHCHIDHIAGFDTFFRCNYNRGDKPVFIWGPVDTAEIMQHRFRGFMWNLLVENESGSFYVTDVDKEKIKTWCFKTAERFAQAHLKEERQLTETILDAPNFGVDARIMDHIVPCLAYLVWEKPKVNIDKDVLQQMKLEPGAWLKEIKDISNVRDKIIEVEGKEFQIGELQDKLLKTTHGQRIAYLTDFRLDAQAEEILLGIIKNCDVIVCESQYLKEDIELAQKNYHMTAFQAAQLAAKAKAGKLILFHLSERYSKDGAQRFLDEAREIFPETYLPENWKFIGNSVKTVVSIARF